MQDDNQETGQPLTLEDLLKQAIVEGFVEVPMLPEIANRAFALANDKDSDASQMAQLIQSDPALAGHVMRIANSAAYTPMANLVSLQQAIARLGMNVISEIAISAVLSAKLFNTPGYETYVEANWHHALATSLWAKEIARHCRVNVEVAFLAGLIHSIGRPAILQTLIDIASQDNLALDPAEVHRLEDQYWLDVSTMVVRRWHMPALVVDTIEHLASPFSDGAASKMAAVVDAAKHFAEAMFTGQTAELSQFGELPSINQLNIYPEETQQLLSMEEVIEQRLKGLTA